MKTDIKEFDDKYEVEIDLPGFKKDEVPKKSSKKLSLKMLGTNIIKISFQITHHYFSSLFFIRSFAVSKLHRF